MTQRLNYTALSQKLFKQYLEINKEVHETPTAKEFGDLVTIYASQLNGCGFCLDMHVKEAKIHGERELRLYHIPIWRESDLFNEREKAAFLWTESLTHLPREGVSDEVYDLVRKSLSEKELSDLTFIVLVINGWNRLGVAFRSKPGSADAIYGLDKSGLE